MEPASSEDGQPGDSPLLQSGQLPHGRRNHGRRTLPRASQPVQASAPAERAQQPAHRRELAGDFTLPRNPRKPLAFVAGGIGITPFRSMLKYLSDRGEKRDIVLLFSSSREDQVAFQDVLEEATQKVGLKATITLTDMANIRAS